MKKPSKRRKRGTKKVLAVLLILSICFSTMNIEAMAEEELPVTQTEQDESETQPSEGESDLQTGEDESDPQTGEDENGQQTGEDENGPQAGEGEHDSQPSEDENGSQTGEDESGSDDNTATEEDAGWDGVTTESVYEGENFKVTFALSGYWNGGYNANVKVENTGKTVIENWTMEVDYAGAISNIWNAVIDSNENGKYIIKNAGWNQDIAVGGSAEFGISGQEDFPGFPKKYTLLGNIVCAEDEDYSITYHLDSDWGDGFTGTISITNNTASAIEDWYLEFDFKRNITNIWNGVTESHKGNHYVIKNAGYNANIDAGQTISFGFSGDKGTSADEPMNYELSSHALSGKKNPKYVDTDGDGLTDYDDVKLGFSPLLKDTDGNGIIDSEERVYQTVTKQLKNPKKEGVIAVSVSLNIKGNAEKRVGIVDMYEYDMLSSGVVGLVGVPVEICCDTDFQQADITFHYDLNALGDTKEEDLSIMWYDEANNWYQILDEDSVIDTANHTVTYTTTHFSTYMLVDGIVWYEAWRQNIDYRNSSSGDTEKKYFDIAFVVDVSGSMSYESRINTAKTAMGNFIDSMQTSDEAALITFSHISSLRQGFTSDKETIRKAVFQMYASGGTDVNSGLVTALSAFDRHECDKQKIIVLICDGDVNYYQSTIDRCIKNDIQIYAVNVANDSTHATLQKMTDQTKGQYYYAFSAEQIDTVIANVIGDTTEQIDPTDTDGDGLYDIFETAGMRLPNGEIITTDPTNPDSDGDGLTDYQETGIVCNVDMRYGKGSSPFSSQYFVMRSYPNDPDSDDDGELDNTDERPLMADSAIVAKLNSKLLTDYLKIKADGNTYYGGDQGWWKDDVTPSNADHQERLEKDRYYRLWKLGCGVIAMSDAELYLTLQNSGYTLRVDSPIVTKFQQTGLDNKDTYKDYVEKQYDKRYHISNDPVSLEVGVFPTQMMSGFSDFLTTNGNPSTNVKWARYNGESFDKQKQDILNDIEEMLNKDIPVVFAYHTFVGEGIKLYDSLQGAKYTSELNEDGIRPQTQPSHYMTIVGLYKYNSEKPMQYNYILQVVSWGKTYYINYDMYANKLSYFSNILSVY